MFINWSVGIRYLVTVWYVDIWFSIRQDLTIIGTEETCRTKHINIPHGFAQIFCGVRLLEINPSSHE